MTSQHNRVAYLAACTMFFSLFSVPPVIHAQPNIEQSALTLEDTGLVLHDTYENVSPFIRQNGNGEVNLPTPLVGSSGILRYYQPGEFCCGAPNPSFINFGTESEHNGYLAINYSGSDNGAATQDQVVYPVGSQLSPNEWTIDFWYKPHYNQNDASAVFYLLTSKDRHNSPDNVSNEQDQSGKAEFSLVWAGWGGRKFFSVYMSGVQVNTPVEYQTDRVRFDAEQWMHMTVIWKNTGIPGLTGKTLALMINGKVVASTPQKLQLLLPFRKYLVLGASSYCPFIGGALTCYSGASGDIDDLKIYNYAKTDFCESSLPELSALISSKSGAQNARSWSLNIANKGSCPAENAQIDSLVLTQTAGAVCTPIISNPLSFPLGVGDIPAGAQASGTATINFTGCPNNARFKATIPFSSNNGIVSGSKTLNNQYR